MNVYIDVENWGFPDENKKFHFFSRHTPNNTGIWNSLNLVRDYCDADCVVCFDKDCKNHQANGKLVIQVRQEPTLIQTYSRYPLADAYVDYQSDMHATFWFIDKPYAILDGLKYAEAIIEKKSDCSAIFSNKHHFRNMFFSALSKAHIDIDYFGRGIETIVDTKSYRGPLIKNGLCKFEGLLPYQKSIAIENSQQMNYFTEKLVDCFMTWTLPIYYGCPNILEIFPCESIRIIDNINDIKSVIEKITPPVTKIEIEAMEYSRQLAMKKYNFWAALERAIERI